MQRKASLSEKHRSIIHNNYVLPLINAIKDKQLDGRFALRKMIDRFELWALLFDRQKLPFLKPPTFFSTFLRSDFNRLKNLYLDLHLQNKKFPDSSGIEIQTLIRELIFNYIDPIPQFKVKNFWDYHNPNDSKMSIRLFTPSSSPPTKYQPLYVIGDQVLITSENGCYNHNQTLLLRHHIPDKEIYASLPGSIRLAFNAFKSLYQATEFCLSFTNYGIFPYIQTAPNSVFMPAIWLVNYTGDMDKLKFTTQFATINPFRSKNSCSGSQKNISMEFAAVRKNQIQPIMGMVACLNGGFGNFRVFNVLDCRKYQAENDMFDFDTELENKISCFHP